MKYNQITPGIFLERPNRFIAYVNIPGISEREKVHVKNTGRCKELLVPGARVFLEKGMNPGRSTAYDLVAVQKGKRLINMDSQAPNKVVGEWLLKGGLFQNITLIKPETTWGNSRFDFYVEYMEGQQKKCKAFIEVKGVTLENDGVVCFPDAPSERAVKHVEELIAAKEAGHRVFVIFVIQMKDVRYFIPNWETHPAFCEALLRARNAGVELLAMDCAVTEDAIELMDEVPVFLQTDEIM